MPTRFTPGSGAVLRPFFDSSYGVERIEVVSGGSGYAKTDPPKITIQGTQTPTTEGVFYPVISGVGTIRSVIVFNPGVGYYPVFSTTTGGQVFVERGVFGTNPGVHTTGIQSVFSGDYNIIDDNIYFSTPPYGKTGLVGLETGSNFSGRIFSRKIDPTKPQDKNLILDDISLEFTGIAGTQFKLTENFGNVTSLFNSVNAGSDINNNPFILINNVSQTPGLDFDIVNSSENSINFLSGVPRAGRITKVGLQTGSGYYSLINASGTIGVGTTGTLSNVRLTGPGQGYRTPPEVIVRSSQGSGGLVTAFLGTLDPTVYNISTAVYNRYVGIVTFTTATAHNYKVGQRVRVVGVGFTFPGLSTSRNINTFAYNPATGIASLTVYGGHYIGTGTNQSRNLLVTQVQVTDGISTFTFREDAYPIVSIGSTNNVEINVGLGTTSLTYVGGGLVQAGVDTAILEGADLIGFDILGVTTNTFKVFAGLSTFNHTYTSGGVVQRNEVGIVTGLHIINPGQNYYIPHNIAYVDYEPSSGVTTITGYGKQLGVTTTIANVFYTPSTGIATIQGTNNHGLSVNDVVKLAGIGFSTINGNVTFPYTSDAFFAVKSISSSIDFAVDIGISTIGVHTHQQGTGTFTLYEGHGLKTDDFANVSGIAMTTNYWPEISVYGFTYNNVTGIATITTTSNHYLEKNDFLLLSGIGLTSGLGTVTYPTITDPSYNGVFVESVGTSTVFSVNIGISTISDYSYVSGGSIQHAVRYPVSYQEGFDLISKQYGDGFYVLEVYDAAKFRVQSGLLTSRYNYTKGGTIEKPISLEIVDPDPYYNLNLQYVSNSTGIGTTGIGVGAKANFSINVDGDIGVFDVVEEGVGYKVGDRLTVSGICTDVRVGVVTQFELSVLEVANDKFFGFYPGQFILFDDISVFFNGVRKKFTLSVTTGGVTSILSLKTEAGSDLDITNNMFIYINDILQTPNQSYTFRGSRIIFSEAPKEGSKCSVFYYRGSDADVELIEPIPTIKPGDVVQIKENKLDILDRDQFPRTTKRIVASDVMETFTYDSVGIDTNQDNERPLSWEKQKVDKILNGVYYSKSRDINKCRVSPATFPIKNIGPTDSEIYVANAFPVFSEVDLLVESERHLKIFENRDISPAIVTSIVSASSSISSLSIASSGSGYLNLSNPIVSISGSKLTRKDIIKDWKFDVITSISTSITLKGLTRSLPVVAVGSSSQYINTLSGTFWERGKIGFGNTITFNAIEVASDGQTLLTVGEYGKAAKAISYGTTISSWTPISLKEERQIPAIGLSVIFDSSFEGSFNDVVYEPNLKTWVAVGAGGSVFNGVGIGTTTLFSQFSGTIQTLNSIVHAQGEFIAVGNGGAIVASTSSRFWDPKQSNTAQNLRDIIYDGTRFIAVGDSGTIMVSSDKNYWQPFSQENYNIATNPATFSFKKIRFIDGIYIALSDVGNLYYSLDLVNWIPRSTQQNNPINDVLFAPFGLEGRFISVGGGATVFYSEPIYNRATATASVSNGIVTSVSIVNGGFGYELYSSPPVLVESDTTVEETIYSFKTKGDFGTIVGINTQIPGQSINGLAPRLEFQLKSQFNDNSNLGYGYSSLNVFGVNNSQLQIGDYFIIYDSPVKVGHALTGISTHVGGLTNYPTNKVGVAYSNIDGVYRVDAVTTADPTSGIVTVTCSFKPGPNSSNQIQVGVGTTALTKYYGKYSWGLVYDYQNRAVYNPKEFLVNSDNGLVGFATAPLITRTKPLT